ncbi:MAG TPA: hypothetical protein VL989_01350 [Candidatus Sulfotelmatobacter sp.]|nr:hypothetical protein [Candidatus Sulfotelmatobacter sp.]
MPERTIEGLETSRIRRDTELLRRSARVAGLALTAAELSMSSLTEELGDLNETYKHMVGTVITVDPQEVITLWEESCAVESSFSSGGERGTFGGFELFDREGLAYDHEHFLREDKNRLEVCLILLPTDTVDPEQPANINIETKTLIPLSQLRGPLKVS